MSSQSIVIKASFKKVSNEYSRAKTTAKATGIAWGGSMLVLASALVLKNIPIASLLLAAVIATSIAAFLLLDWRNEKSKWSSASSSCTVGDSCGNEECAPEKQGSCATRLGAERDKAMLKGELERLEVLLDRQGKASYAFLGLWILLGIGLAIKAPNTIAAIAAGSLTLSSILEGYVLKIMRKIASSI
ncbi:MAG: hypothetical protein M0Z45_07900 [Actinomycetota bacterium]|nr:hypothetical protein [Actinomycetota bacterium]